MQQTEDISKSGYIKLHQFTQYLLRSDRVRILHNSDNSVAYEGFAYRIPHELSEHQITDITHIAELRHANWEELGLEAPMLPDITPDYKFEELDMRLYTQIKISEGI